VYLRITIYLSVINDSALLSMVPILGR